jgi:hypothetical protein
MRQIGEKGITSLLSSNHIRNLNSSDIAREGLSKDLALNLTQ